MREVVALLGASLAMAPLAGCSAIEDAWLSGQECHAPPPAPAQGSPSDVRPRAATSTLEVRAPVSCDAHTQSIDLASKGRRKLVATSTDTCLRCPDGRWARATAKDLASGVYAARRDALCADPSRAATSSCDPLPEALLQEAADEAAGSDRNAAYVGLGLCAEAGGGGYFVEVYDWRLADRAIDALAIRLATWDIEGNVEVRVSERVVYCPAASSD